MERSERTFHKRLIEMCDCYLETDFPAQLTAIAQIDSANPEEDAIRYLALAIMQSLTKKAKRLSFKKKEVTTIIMNTGEETALPVPSAALVDAIFRIMAGIVHLEGGKIDTILSMGLRTDQIDLKVKMEKKEGKEFLKLDFPQD